MPITPTEAAELTSVEVSQLLELVCSIDEQLKEKYTGQPDTEYTISVDSQPSERLICCMKSIYNGKGWQIRTTWNSNSFYFKAKEDKWLHTSAIESLENLEEIKKAKEYEGLTFEEIRLASIDIGDEDESIGIQDTREQRVSNQEDGPGER